MTRRIPAWLWWLFGGLAATGVLALYFVAVRDAPVWLYPALRTPAVGPSGGPPPALTPGERLTAAHNARFLVVSIGGAIVVLGGLVFTGINYRLAHRGQATERFTQALERLGSPELYVRIGGVHALQQLMRDSARHHGDIVEVLVAFVRAQAPRARSDDGKDVSIYPRPRLPAEPAADVQVALTALGTRPQRPPRERSPLHLSELHLHRADLGWAQLQGADLVETQLQGARLREAQLQNADLRGALLQDADLSEAQLQNAKLFGAQMQGARLREAQLQDAFMVGVQLQHADLRGARMENAQLIGAQAQDADLSGALLQGAHLGAAQLQNANLFGAQMQGAWLGQLQLLVERPSGKQWQGDLIGRPFTAKLASAQMQGAYLGAADLTGLRCWTQEQLDQAEVNEDTVLPDTRPGPPTL